MTLTGQTIIVAAARLANQGAVMVAAMIVAYALSRNDAGIVQKALLVTNMCVLVGMFGIQTALFTQLPKLPADRRRGLIVQSTALLALMGAVLAAAVFLGRGLLAAYLNDPQVLTLLPLAALTVFLVLPSGVVEPTLITADRPLRLLAAAIPAAALHIGIMLGAWFFAPHTLPQAVLIGMALAAAVRLGVGAWHTFREMRGPWIPTDLRPALATQLAFILPVGAVSAIDTVATMLDRNIVAHYFTSAQYSSYTYGAMEIPLLGLLIGAVTPVLLPRFSAMLHRGDTRATVELWHRATLKTATVVFATFMLFLCIAPEFLTLLYSEKYRDSALFMRIYLLLLPLRVIAFMPLLYALGKQKTVLIGSALDLALNCALSLTLVRLTPLGMAGAAVATVTSTALQAGFYLYIIRNALSLTWTTVLPWNALAKRFAVVLVAFSPTLTLTLCGGFSAPVILGTATACLVGYALFLYRK